MPIVTISRELGSRGTRIAEAVAERLGSVCINKQVLAEMAQQAGVSVEVIVEAEERLLARPNVVSEEMRAFFSKKAQNKPGVYDEATYVEQMSEAIRAMASGGNAVFVGRGAQLILVGQPQVFHVHIYAEPEVRAARIQRRRNYATLADGLLVVKRADEQRRDWYRRFFTGANWKDPRYYHLMIDTGRIAVDRAADMIAEVAKTEAPAPG